jgi:hypothetical protein
MFFLHTDFTATQAAMGLATSLHNMDEEEGRASVAHTDISPIQFITINGVSHLGSSRGFA